MARGGAAGSGLALLFALTSCVGLMPGLAAGRSGERRRPRYVAVVLIAGFFFATSWVLVGSIATGQTAGLAGLAGSDLVPALAASYVGAGFGAVLGLLLCASLLALMLATHRAAARAVGPTARTRASLVLTGVTAAVVAIGAVAGLDPYLTRGRVAHRSRRARRPPPPGRGRAGIPRRPPPGRELSQVSQLTTETARPMVATSAISPR